MKQKFLKFEDNELPMSKSQIGDLQPSVPDGKIELTTTNRQSVGSLQGDLRANCTFGDSNVRGEIANDCERRSKLNTNMPNSDELRTNAKFALSPGTVPEVVGKSGDSLDVQTPHISNGNVLRTYKSNSKKTKNYSRNNTLVRAKRVRSKRERQEQLQAAYWRTEDNITFDPGNELRNEIVETLQLKSNAPARIKLVKKLTKEFLRIYKRRRTAVQPNYAMSADENKYAAKAAELCIIKSVTPNQLIDYWEDNVGNFTGMQFPSLNFLAIAGNVDRVSVEVAIPKRKKKRKKAKNDPVIHAFSGDVDPRLRPGLVAAGLIESSEISDRHLSTVESTAKNLKLGHDLFVSSKMRPLVDWALKNLFQ